jgi:hypothetical protein
MNESTNRPEDLMTVRLTPEQSRLMRTAIMMTLDPYQLEFEIHGPEDFARFGSSLDQAQGLLEQIDFGRGDSDLTLTAPRDILMACARQIVGSDADDLLRSLRLDELRNRLRMQELMFDVCDQIDRHATPA